MSRNRKASRRALPGPYDGSCSFGRKANQTPSLLPVFVLSGVPETLAVTYHDFLAFGDTSTAFAFGARFAGTEHEDADPPLTRLAATGDGDLDETVAELGVGAVGSYAAVVVDEAGLVAAAGGVDGEVELPVEAEVVV